MGWSDPFPLRSSHSRVVGEFAAVSQSDLTVVPIILLVTYFRMLNRRYFIRLSQLETAQLFTLFPGWNTASFRRVDCLHTVQEEVSIFLLFAAVPTQKRLQVRVWSAHC